MTIYELAKLANLLEMFLAKEQIELRESERATVMKVVNMLDQKVYNIENNIKEK